MEEIYCIMELGYGLVVVEFMECCGVFEVVMFEVVVYFKVDRVGYEKYFWCLDRLVYVYG